MTPFLLTIDSLGGDLIVLGFKGRERVNGPFRFEIRVACSDAVDQQAVLGRAARLEITVGRAVRSVVQTLRDARADISRVVGVESQV